MIIPELPERLQYVSAFSLIILSGGAFLFVFAALHVTGLLAKYDNYRKEGLI